MSEKIRIYQLAKDLEIETKDMLSKLDDMGVEYKSHASTIDGDTADAVRQLVESDRDGSAESGDKAATESAAATAKAQTAPATSVVRDDDDADEGDADEGDADDADV